MTKFWIEDFKDSLAIDGPERSEIQFNNKKKLACPHHNPPSYGIKLYFTSNLLQMASTTVHILDPMVFLVEK